MLADLLEELTPQLSHRVPGEKAAALLARLVDTLRMERVDAQACEPFHDVAHAERFVKTLGSLKDAVYEAIEERRLAVPTREMRLLGDWFALLNERALVAENRRFAAMLDALPDHLFLWDLESRFLYVNRAAAETAEQLFGLSRRELIGVRSRDLDFGDEPSSRNWFRQYTDDLCNRVLHGEMVREQFQLPRVDGGGLWREHHLAPVFDAQGKVEAIAVASRDIHARKKAEDELAQAVAFREQVMGMLSHDLRNPLSAVLGLTRLLQQRKDLSDSAREHLVRITQAAERMAEMISTILDVTQLRFRGDPQLSLERVDLDAVAREVIDELRVTHLDHTVELVTYGDVSGEWDPGRVAQVVSNLLGNALTHGAPGAPVRIALSGLDGEVELEVTNHGATIPPDQAAHLFEPFWQAPSASAATRRRGLGLGLYIVHELVRIHGGVVHIRSSDGITTFTVRLPRRLAH